MRGGQQVSRRLIDVLEYLVDERVGIIRNLVEVPRDAGAPDFFHFYARACNTRAFTKQKNFADSGGASVDRSMAMAKAVGEAVERYCAAIYRADDFPVCSYADAAFPCIAPGSFALYSKEQYVRENFPYRPFRADTPVRWIPAVDLTTGDICHVPAAMVFMPYYYDREGGEVPIMQPISTGLACHCSKAEAVISAICEVIERDAFTITWQAKLAMPHLLVESLSVHNRDIVKRFEQTGSSITLLDLTMDHGIATVLATARSQSPESPALIFAASADLNPDDAIRKSLEELIHTRRLAVDLKSSWPSLQKRPDFENIVRQEHHVRLYCDQDNTHLADFLFSSDKRVSYKEMTNFSTGDPDKDQAILIETITALNHQVLVADLTTTDIEILGLRVIRAIIPGFHPLFMGRWLRALGGTRLWDIPGKLGHVGISKDSGDNPAPHPYP